MSKSKCHAYQFSDMMKCLTCGLSWDMNDRNPPDCKPKPAERYVAIVGRPTHAPDILAAAAAHQVERKATYAGGEHGERSMEKIVAVFNAFHDTNITEAQGWHFMQILKDVRLFSAPGYHADSGEDCVSYAALKAEAIANKSNN